MPGSWVIFEGPDGAGKTTMALRAVQILSGQGPTVYQHLTSTSDFSEYYGPPRLWQGAGLNVVQDRCAVSDLVYAPVLSGVRSRFGEEAVRAQLELVAQRAHIIHVTADEETLEERLEERGDDLVVGGMLHAILKNYWEEMDLWVERGAVISEFDTTDDEFPSEVELGLALSMGEVELAKKLGGH